MAVLDLEVNTIPVATIIVPSQFDRFHEKGALKELSLSIKQKGVLQAIIVRTIPGHADGEKYELIAGSRRLAATKLAGITTIPAKVGAFTDEEADEIRIIENLQRENPKPLEECKAFHHLAGRFAGSAVQEVASRVGRSPQYVAQRMSLVALTAKGKKMLDAGILPVGVAIVLSAYTEDEQKSALEWFTRGEMFSATVRELREWMAEHGHVSLSLAPWDLDDSELLPKAGSCSFCPKQAANQPLLFSDMPMNTCTDGSCFHKKLLAFAVTQNLVRVSCKTYGVDQGALSSEDWRKATPNCAAPTQALVVQAGDKWTNLSDLKVGDKITICEDKSCKAHKDGRPGVDRETAKSKAKEREALKTAKVETTRRIEVLRRVVAANGRADSDVPTQVLKALIGGEGTWGSITMPYDRFRVVCDVYGWTPPKVKGERVDYEAEVVKHVGEVKLVPFLAVVALAADAKVAANWPSDPKRLNSVAKAFGVDAPKVKVPEAPAKEATVKIKLLRRGKKGKRTR